MRLLTIAVLTACAAGLSAAAPSRATFPAQQQRLLILTEASGIGANLELLGPGSQKVDLGFFLGVNGSAAVGPDGMHVAVNSSIPLDPGNPNSAELFTGGFLIADGGEIAHDVALGGRPSWSPDGTKLAYADKVGGRWDVFVAASDGSGATDLTNNPAADDRNPRWSPDGSRIAFESDRTGNWDVFGMVPDGSGQTNLTQNPAEDRLGDWSPDSTKIVFSSTRSGGGDLYVMPAGGGPASQLTSGPGADTHAAWSPDGRTIAFSNDAGGSDEVYEIASDGTGLQRLTNNSYVDVVQDWQPLRDTQAPTVRALRSKGLRRHSVRLKFRVSEDSRRADVELEASYRTKRGTATLSGGQLVNGISPGHTYAFHVPAEFLKNAPASIRFCVHALDPSLNESARSCARFSFLRPKKKKR